MDDALVVSAGKLDAAQFDATGSHYFSIDLRMRAISIPLSGGQTAVLDAPATITELDHRRIIDTLELWKSAMTGSAA